MADGGKHVRNRRNPGNPGGGHQTAAGQRRSGAPRKSKSGTPAGKVLALFVAGAVLVVLGVFTFTRFRSGRQNSPSETQAPSSPTEQVTGPSEALPETPQPTPEGPRAVLYNGRIVPGTWGAEVRARDTEASESYFVGAAFIGNSLIDGMRLWSGIKNCEYIYHTDMRATTVTNYLWDLTVKEYDSLYLMLGINEIGESLDSFLTAYRSAIDTILTYQPTATVYIMSITPVTREKSDTTFYKIDVIRKFNEALRDLAAEKECWYLDVYGALEDEDGYLPNEISFDGIHFEKSGYKLWASYLKTHYVDDKLVDEVVSGEPAETGASPTQSAAPTEKPAG